MANFMVLFKKNIIEIIRSKRIWVFSIVFSGISIISALTAKFLPMLLEFLMDGFKGTIGGSMFIPEGTVADSYIQLISNVGEISVFLVLIMFASVITKEKIKGTYYNLKMNKVSDSNIVLSHLLANVCLVSVSYLVSVAIFVISNIILFNQIMGIRGFVVLSYLYLLLLVAICFAIFVSCICKKNSHAYLIVILSYFVFGFLDIIPKINKFNPMHLLSVGMNLMYYESYSLSENLISGISSIAICAILIILSLFVVKNKIDNTRKEIYDNTRGI